MLSIRSTLRLCCFLTHLLSAHFFSPCTQQEEAALPIVEGPQAISKAEAEDAAQSDDETDPRNQTRFDNHLNSEEMDDAGRASRSFVHRTPFPAPFPLSLHASTPALPTHSLTYTSAA